MKNSLCYVIISFLLVFFFSCDNPAAGPSADAGKDTDFAAAHQVMVDSSEVLENSVLTQEQQNALTPAEVLNILKEGNDDFVNDRLTIRNTSSRIRAAAMSQYPKAVILSCLDSRVPVEDVFHRGIGDIFVARVAGNIENEDILGSMEYGCKVSGARLILVLGHEHCGAIKSAIDDVKLGNITALLAKIRPAVTSLTGFNGDKSSKNDSFVHAVCEQNVKLTIENIRKHSPILATMEKDKTIIIQGAIYNMGSGKVIFL
ncbi:carbonic anhydrase [Pseudoflavitalea sp. X16]|uniref:carbonic anhydrase family protein n=1 Tax=Paraflavitalea devenefica TaxID=2716334 RepID=UPI00141F47F1|nr:carbonic anhydrase family protein [Paraflavitalea devenefica]NII27424.1 carbonic anhydrase [Paraflavitalea devenefica]